MPNIPAALSLADYHMTSGKEYERFVYEKFRKLFNGFQVSLNDRILGIQSNIKREIDVSIRGTVGEADILYIVQCKDHKKPADIKIIGEFSSVVQDVKASKGYLICSSGFAKSIHQFARSLGIELITVEDINSERWRVEIEVPVTYIFKKFKISYSAQIFPTPELVKRNETTINVSARDFEEISLNSGKTSSKIIDYLNSIVEREKIDVEKAKSLRLNDPKLMLKFAEIWVPVVINVEFESEDLYHIKFVRPDEYAQIVDHLRNKKQLLSMKLNELKLGLDDSYVPIEKTNIPVSTPVRIEIEENLHPINELKFDMSGIRLNHVKGSR